MSPWSDRMHRRPPTAMSWAMNCPTSKIIQKYRNSEGVWKTKIGPTDCGHGWADRGSSVLPIAFLSKATQVRCLAARSFPPGRLRAPRIGRRDNEPTHVSWRWFISVLGSIFCSQFFYCIFCIDIRDSTIIDTEGCKHEWWEKDLNSQVFFNIQSWIKRRGHTQTFLQDGRQRMWPTNAGLGVCHGEVSRLLIFFLKGHVLILESKVWEVSQVVLVAYRRAFFKVSRTPKTSPQKPQTP